IAADAIERDNTLFDRDAGHGTRLPVSWPLLLRGVPDVSGGKGKCLSDIPTDASRLALQLVASDLDGTVETIKLSRIRQQRPIATVSHPVDDLSDASLDRRILSESAVEQGSD